MKKELSANESAILELIPKGYERVVTIDMISQLTGISPREVQGGVNRLVFKHKIPIVGNRGQGGIFIPVSDEERGRYLKGIKNQASDLTKRVEIVEAADLNNWDEDLILNHQERLEV